MDVSSVTQHVKQHWPLHLTWLFPVVAFLWPSLHAYEVAHPGTEASQAIGIALTLAARYLPLGKS